MLKVEIEDRPHALGLGGVDDQAAAARVDIITKDRMPADPFALFPRRRLLVARALGNDLAFKLREGQEDVQRQPPQRVGGVELLGDRHEAHATFVEHLDDSREVHERPAEPVDLVDDHAVHLGGLDIHQELLQRGPIHVAAGVAAVVVVGRHQLPAFVALAQDVRLARLALRVERVELLLEAFVGGLPGVDRATDRLRDRVRTVAVGLAVTVSHRHWRSPRASGKRGSHSTWSR